MLHAHAHTWAGQPDCRARVDAGGHSRDPLTHLPAVTPARGGGHLPCLSAWPGRITQGSGGTGSRGLCQPWDNGGPMPALGTIGGQQRGPGCPLGRSHQRWWGQGEEAWSPKTSQRSGQSTGPGRPSLRTQGCTEQEPWAPCHPLFTAALPRTPCARAHSHSPELPPPVAWAAHCPQEMLGGPEAWNDPPASAGCCPGVDMLGSQDLPWEGGQCPNHGAPEAELTV